MSQTNQGWNPDKVAPHVGDVYDRDMGPANNTIPILGIIFGFIAAIGLIGAQHVLATGTFMGMPI